MRRSTVGRWLPAPLALLAAIVPTACVGATTTPDPGGSGSPDPGTEAPPDGPAIRWADVGTVELDGRWTLTDCDGDAPLVCVLDDDEPAGVIELLRFVQADPPAAGEELAWLHDWYRIFAADLVDDRVRGCGDGYELTAAEPVPTILDGDTAIAYTIAGRGGDGVAREHGFAIAAVEGHTLTIVGASAYDAEGCLGSEEDTWTVPQMASFAEHVRAIAAGSELPDVEGPVDGLVRGRVTARTTGEITIDTVDVLSGVGAVTAARADGELAEGEPGMPNDVYVRDRVRDTLTLALGVDVNVALYDCTAGCELVDVEADDWLAGTVGAHGGTHAVYDVTISDGVVVAVAEQYLP